MDPIRVKRWLDENPQVFKRFEEEALRVIMRGFRHYSARTILEVLRHESNLRADPGGWKPLKINDHITPMVSRMFMKAHPEAPKNFFSMRRAAADEVT